MDKLKTKIKGWPEVLKWASQFSSRDLGISEEEALEKSIFECLNRDSSSPRLTSSSKSMEDVEAHFKTTEIVDKATLALYQSMLKVNSRTDVLAFLFSCLQGDTDEKFLEMPTLLISHMNGRPCRTRDFDHLPELTQPSRPFSKTPTILVSNGKITSLVVRGIEVMWIAEGGDFLVAVPTSSSLEQLVLLCSRNGLCKVLSTTRRNVAFIGEFQLDVPENETLDWIDVLCSKGHTILYWGGTDALRGQITWNYFSGMNLHAIQTEDELFYDCEIAVSTIESVSKQAMLNMDFTLHGNLLTLWTQRVDEEKDDVREWTSKTELVAGSYKCPQVSQKTQCVWGAPQQYVTLEENEVKVWVCGEHRNSFKSPSGTSMCVLYAHSR